MPTVKPRCPRARREPQVPQGVGLADPGSPTSASPLIPRAESTSASSNTAHVSARPTSCRQSKPLRSRREDQGVRRMSGRPRGVRLAACPLRAPQPPQSGRGRCRVRLVQGAQQPTSPQAHACLMPLRRARNLVDRRGRVRSRGPGAASVVRRRADNGGERECSPHSMTERSSDEHVFQRQGWCVQHP